MLKITCVCFSVETRSYLLKKTERTQKSSLHQFSPKLTRADLMNTRPLFAGWPCPPATLMLSQVGRPPFYLFFNSFIYSGKFSIKGKLASDEGRPYILTGGPWTSHMSPKGECGTSRTTGKYLRWSLIRG